MSLSRNELVALLREEYIPRRMELIEPEFIQFEEEMAALEDLKHIIELFGYTQPIPNPHNSALIYITGCSDEMDFTKGVHTIGGSYADLDLDFETQGYQTVINWILEKYGRECVSSIGTVMKFKPKGIVKKFFATTAPQRTEPDYEKKMAAHFKTQSEILEMIPDALFGKEPTLQECLEGNPKKGFKPHPELATDPRYKPWYETAKKLEGMVATYSIHAAGVVISDFPISDVCPLSWKRDKDKYSKEETERWITQFTMDEIAELGLVKFDLLRIESLSIIKQCCRLINERHNVAIDVYALPDDDGPTYDLMATGNLGGVFQLEASQSAKDWTRKMKPRSIMETSDLISLIRPGPVQAGLTNQYLINKQNGYAPDELHPLFADVFKDSYWVLTYQEQVLALLAKVAGFSLEEADDVRRAIGKKKTDKLIPSREAFIKGSVLNGVPEDYATEFWDKTIIGFADYSFGAAHGCSYAVLAYVCAYLKAHYPTEFFTALMGVKSQVLQPLDWADKAPTYIQEARHFGISVKTPDINKSASGFTIDDNTKAIHFGLGSIRKVGVGTSEKIVKARGDRNFTNIKDFLSRVDRSKVNTGVYHSLVLAGCFDSLGYNRQELLAFTDEMYSWFKISADAIDRKALNTMREIENIEIQKLIEQRDEIRKRVKKKNYEPCEADTIFLEENKRLALHRMLAIPEVPDFPSIPRYKSLRLSIQDLLTQGELIGCYLPHPAHIAYPGSTYIASIRMTQDYEIAGIVGDIKTYNNSRGSTTYLQVSDGTGSLRIPIYSNSRLPIPKKGDLIWLSINCGVNQVYDEEGENVSLKVFKTKQLEIWKG